MSALNITLGLVGVLLAALYLFNRIRPMSFAQQRGSYVLFHVFHAAGCFYVGAQLLADPGKGWPGFGEVALLAAAACHLWFTRNRTRRERWSPPEYMTKGGR